MDPNPTNFPILSYVMSRLPSSISALRSPRAAPQDIEQPPFSTAFSASSSSSSSSSAPFHDPLIESMPHLKDPKIMSAMAEAVSEISQTRSILQALGERPDHESIDIAKSKVSEIDSALASQLDEVSLSQSSAPEVDKEKEKLEREKTMYKAVIQLDEMHDAYEKLLRSAEEKLMKVYDSAVREKESGDGGGGDDDDNGEISEEVNEEIVAILKNDSVEKVDLSGRKLRILPEAFGKLRHLLVLNMSSNQLQSIPDSIAGLENLEELNLSSNSLQSLPDSIGLLLNLKFFNVSGNKLSALPDSICFCRSLVELDASFNSLGYLPTNIGLEMVDLRKLSVPYNKIRSLPTSVGEMRSLQHLDVHFNELHGLPMTIGNVTTLVTINLSGNFSDMKELPETFCELINLEELDLSNNQIHALPDLFGKLEKLRKLNLDQNPIVIPPLEVVNSGAEAVKNYMNKRWNDLLFEEEERKKQQMLAAQETGWLKRSVSKLNDAVTKASEYLGSPRTPRDPILDQQL